jgi:hypothetical protein
VAWWVYIAPEVESGVKSFGFRDPDKILGSVEYNLANYGEAWAMGRWDKCPNDYFVYSHLFIDGGRWHNLLFIVRDTSASIGVLEAVWVQHYPGDLL